MNKKGTNNKTLITYLLVIFMIICEIYRLKNIFIESNNVLETSISNLLYPFTFLLITLIYKNSNFKETHKSIIKTSVVFLIFILLTTILNNIPSNYYLKSKVDDLLNDKKNGVLDLSKDRALSFKLYTRESNDGKINLFTA